MICADRTCFCGITSESLAITGTGAEGDPWVVEATAFMIVTSATRPGSPATWQHIFETDTGRQLYWNGVHWVIVAGNFPAFSAYLASAQNMDNNVYETVIGLTEIHDADSIYNTGTGVATIPTGMGGDWQFNGEGFWTGNATGARFLTIAVGANTSVTGEAGAATVADGPATAYNSPHQSVSDTFRLEAGATVSLNGFQNSGAGLDLTLRKFRGRMVRSIPSLT